MATKQVQRTERPYETLKHEYTELALMFKHYSALRFAVLTVFFAVTGAIASVAFGVAKASAPDIAVYAKAAGLFVSVAFFMLEVLIEQYLRYFVARAHVLEDSLGYAIFSGRPQFKWLQTRFSTWGLFGSIIIAWVVSIAVI